MALIHRICFRHLLLVLLTGVRVFADQRVEQLREASRLIESHELGSAEAILQALVAQRPTDGIALNLIGVIRMQQQEPAQARQFFERAVAASPGIVGPRLNLARLYGSAHPFDAFAQLKQALEMAPDDAAALALLRGIATQAALSAARSGDKQQSLAVMTAAREVRPEDPELLYNYGLAALDAGTLRESRSALEELLQINPQLPDAHYALARVLLEAGSPGEAESQMRIYLTARPNDATAHYGLGYVLAAEQKTREARVEFRKSLDLASEQTESLFGLGELDLEAGDSASAIALFGKVLALDSKHAGALTGLGMTAYRAGNYADARMYLERAIAAAPSYQKAHYYYSLTLKKLDLKPEAAREFELSQKLQKPHGSLPILERAQQ